MHIALIEPLSVPQTSLERLAAPLRAAGHTVDLPTSRTEDAAELAARAAGAEAVISGNAPLPESFFDALPSLRMLSVAFTGLDHVAVGRCRERGIVVCNAQGYATEAVAELALGFILAGLRNLIPCDRAVREGGTRAGLVGGLLQGRTLGIVGFGAIGRRVAELAQPFGCRILCCGSGRRAPEPHAGAEPVSLDELLAQSDIVTMHVPLTDSTYHLLDRARLERMKRGAYFVNTARGKVVDCAALAEVLRAGHLSGAAIDVFAMEPPIPPSHPLLGAPNTVLAPHVAFASLESLESRAEIAFGNVTAWLGGAPRNVC